MKAAYSKRKGFFMSEKLGYILWFLTGIFCLGLCGLLTKQFPDEIQANEETFSGEAPKIALTFDDGPSSAYTPKLLKGLKERGVCASFFLQGQSIAGNEEIVKKMQQEGHLVGNHTFHHVQLTAVSDAQAVDEVTKTSNEIYKITGVYTSYLRPPFGEWKKKLDYRVTMIPVLWTLDSRDWITQNTQEIVKEVLSSVKEGDIILMHDIFDTSVEAALQIIDQLKEKGYEFVTVEELILE